MLVNKMIGNYTQGLVSYNPTPFDSIVSKEVRELYGIEMSGSQNEKCLEKSGKSGQVEIKYFKNDCGESAIFNNAIDFYHLHLQGEKLNITTNNNTEEQAQEFLKALADGLDGIVLDILCRLDPNN